MVNIAHAYSIHDLRLRARRVLPRAVFDFVDGAADDELAARRNADRMEELRLLPRALAGTSARNQGLDLFGQPLSHPFLIAPTGSAGVVWPRGEIEAAKAACASGGIYITSHASTVTLEDIACAASGRLWFQSFIFRDPALTERMIARAEASSYEALVITVDTQVPSKRERDVRNAFTVPPRLRPGLALDFCLHPRWALRLARAGVVRAANYEEMGLGSLIKAGMRIPSLLDTSIGWSDIARVRARWPRKLVLKGIMHPDEAARAVAEGVDAIVVSNHGGRQYDAAPASIDALPAVAQAVAGRIPILFDGGVRRGGDLLKARALGATAVLLGRPHLWGLAVAGEAGVARALAILRKELDVAMALAGFNDIAAVSSADLFRSPAVG